MMHSPKARFQMSKGDVEWHAALVAGIQFERAADAAMLTVANAAPSADQIVGARDFLKAFTELSTIAKPPVPQKDNRNLS